MVSITTCLNEGSLGLKRLMRIRNARVSKNYHDAAQRKQMKKHVAGEFKGMVGTRKLDKEYKDRTGDRSYLDKSRTAQRFLTSRLR